MFLHLSTAIIKSWKDYKKSQHLENNGNSNINICKHTFHPYNVAFSEKLPAATAKKTVVSYAQVLEGIILYNVFDNINYGFYIDVGANDPIHDSVTKLFYELGWHGINIEPLQFEYGRIAADRDRDINLCMAAGKESGEMKLFERGGLSTLYYNIAKNWETTPIARSVKIEPMSTICKQYCQEGQVVHFCKIDVEGFEKDVLEGFDFSIVRPLVFVIEATEPCTMIPTHQQWEDILVKNDYEFVYQFGVNRYYVDKHTTGLKEKFIGMDELLQKYLVIKML